MQSLAMEVNSGIGNINLSKKSSLRLILAESSESVSQPLVDELRKDNHVISICKKSGELFQTLSNQKTDILMIGTLEDSSYLEVYRRCSEQLPGLRVILLSPQPAVNDFFRNWVIAKGIYDVLSSHVDRLYILREVIQKISTGTEPTAELATLETSKNELENIPVSTNSPTELQVFAHKQPPSTPKPISPVAVPATSKTLSYEQVLSALNQITDCSMNYFGGMAIGNYWKKAQVATIAEYPWLQSWVVDYRGGIAYFSESIPQEQITSEQLKSLQLWVGLFLKECDRIIVDYTQMLSQMGVSEQVKQIISS
ncbi:hypothetical protein TUMEXPCC7403_07700 [Tumidithrix helvetica PCC 7403]|uniref:hypothetical protein n=1 Tax=Tumidithrix helvetica TaxID=3457545 RepID=UPI003C9333D6